MQTTMSKTRQEFPLSPKKIIKKTLGATLAWVIILLLFDVITFFMLAVLGQVEAGAIATLGVLVLLCILIAITYIYEKWYFAVYFYDLTQDYIVIKKGPITPREITIPYERIQDVYVDQDLLDRAFGLYDVHLSSATVSSGMEAHIDGVEKQAADGLRALLLNTVKQKISKTQTPTPASTNY